MRKIVFFALLITAFSQAVFAYSGVIIDATASLAPVKLHMFASNPDQIQLSDKQTNNDLNNVFDNGLICYTTSIDSAKESGFVGSDPLVVHAISRIDCELNTDVIIQTEDAEKIVKICKNPDFLGRLKIAYIL